MDIKEIQPLLERLGSAILLEDGRPWSVLMNLDTFRKLTGTETPVVQPEKPQEPAAEVPVTVERGLQRKTGDVREAEVMERLNSEIQALKDQLTADQERVERSLEDLWPAPTAGDGEVR